MKPHSRLLPYGLLLLLGASATAYLLVSAAISSQAVQNPTIHLDMFTTGNTYDTNTNTMSIGSIDSSLTSANASTHHHPVHLVIKDVEDLAGFQVRLNYTGDKMRPITFNTAIFLDESAGQLISFLSLPVDQSTLVHRDVISTDSIPPAPADGSNTAQTALIGASYLGIQTFAVSPDTPHKAVPDDSSYSAPSGGVLGNLNLQVVGNECGQTMFMDLDDGVPNSPGSQATIFTGTGTTTIHLTESQLFDGAHTEACATPSPSPTPTPAADSDADGWSDGAEVIIGTAPNDPCADDLSDNAWPADINNDTFSDISDITFLTGDFGDPVPAGAPPRHNIAPDPPDGFVDITDITRMTGLFGASCASPP